MEIGITAAMDDLEGRGLWCVTSVALVRAEQPIEL